MNIQSLSVVVPNPSCINRCAFCVSRMHQDFCKNQIDDNLPFFDLYLKDYLKRLNFARSNGCNTVMLTGNSEPQQNHKFLTYFGLLMQLMSNPFQWIEMQTTGTLLDQNYLRFIRNHVGVNIISLSLSSFDSFENSSIIGMPPGHEVDIPFLCSEIKRYDFTLRLSLNLSDAFHQDPPDVQNLFKQAKALGADQVTLRKLYHNGQDTPQARWVAQHAYKDIDELSNYVLLNGHKITTLPFGAVKYSLDGMSVVLDDDCMAKKPELGNAVEQYKYLVLQPDCKLYGSWDDKATLIF